MNTIFVFGLLLIAVSMIGGTRRGHNEIGSIGGAIASILGHRDDGKYYTDNEENDSDGDDDADDSPENADSDIDTDPNPDADDADAYLDDTHTDPDSDMQLYIKKKKTYLHIVMYTDKDVDLNSELAKFVPWNVLKGAVIAAQGGGGSVQHPDEEIPNEEVSDEEFSDEEVSDEDISNAALVKSDEPPAQRRLIPRYTRKEMGQSLFRSNKRASHL